jgi:prepilin-type processing-associated H-X9-DG protein
MGLALHNYHDTHRCFPIGQQFRGGFDGVADTAGAAGSGGTGFAWSAYILPYMDAAPLYNQFNFSVPISNSGIPASVVNARLAGTALAWARCPSDIAPPTSNTGGAAAPHAINPHATTSYKASSGSFDGNENRWPFSNASRQDGFFYRDSCITMTMVTDGMSNTILVGELSWTRSENGRMYGAIDPQSGWANDAANDGSNRLMACGQRTLNPPLTALTSIHDRYHSLHVGGAHFLFGDGSVKFISENIQSTEFVWDANNLYDRNNGGRGYGTYQRLFSRTDAYPIGEF